MSWRDWINWNPICGDNGCTRKEIEDFVFAALPVVGIMLLLAAIPGALHIGNNVVHWRERADKGCLPRFRWLTSRFSEWLDYVLRCYEPPSDSGELPKRICLSKIECCGCCGMPVHFRWPRWRLPVMSGWDVEGQHFDGCDGMCVLFMWIVVVVLIPFFGGWTTLTREWERTEGGENYFLLILIAILLWFVAIPWTFLMLFFNTDRIVIGSLRGFAWTVLFPLALLLYVFPCAAGIIRQRFLVTEEDRAEADREAGRRLTTAPPSQEMKTGRGSGLSAASPKRGSGPSGGAEVVQAKPVNPGGVVVAQPVIVNLPAGFNAAPAGDTSVQSGGAALTPAGGPTPVNSAADKANIDRIKNGELDVLLAAFEAAEQNSVQVLRYAVEEEGLGVSARNLEGYNLLEIAARLKHVDAVEYLVGRGATSQDKDVLFTAVTHGWASVVPQIAHALDPHKVNTVAVGDKSCLDIAVKNQHKEVFQALLLAECTRHLETAIFSAVELDWKQAVELAVSVNSFPINTQNADGSTMLHVAAKKGYVDIVRWLLDSGADRNVPNNAGFRPIDVVDQAKAPFVAHLLTEVKNMDPQATMPNQALRKDT